MQDLPANSREVKGRKDESSGRCRTEDILTIDEHSRGTRRTCLGLTADAMEAGERRRIEQRGMTVLRFRHN